MDNRDKDKIDEMSEYISKVRHAILATYDRGALKTRYVYFYSEGLDLYMLAFPSFDGGERIEDSSSVSVLIPFIVKKENSDDLSDYRYVSIEGRVELLTDEAKKEEIFQSFLQKNPEVKEPYEVDRISSCPFIRVIPLKATYLAYKDFFESGELEVSIDLGAEEVPTAQIEESPQIKAEEVAMEEAPLEMPSEGEEPEPLEEEISLEEDLLEAEAGEAEAELEEEPAIDEYDELLALEEESESQISDELASLEEIELPEEGEISLKGEEEISEEDLLEDIGDLDALEEDLISLEDEIDLEEEIELLGEEETSSGESEGDEDTSSKAKEEGK